MKDSPWHSRHPSTQDFQWYKNLVELHELTTSWLKEVQSDRPGHLLTRGLSPEVAENLWILESISETPLEALLDDTEPQDLLGRLERTIWAVQAWTLAQISGKSPSSNKNSLESVLEQSSWKLGKDSVEKRWKTLARQGQQDLREILLAFNDSPFSGYPHHLGFLVRRATQKEIQIELRSCPHHNPYPEVKPVADRLCRLHSHWMRGYAYSLNNRVSLEHLVQNPRCVQRWFFA